MAVLTVPARIEELVTVNEFLEDHIPPEFQNITPHVRLAAEELLVNIFTHSYAGGPGEARVECRSARLADEEFLFFSVTDWGPPFDPFDEAPAPDLDLDAAHRPIGGLGNSFGEIHQRPPRLHDATVRMSWNFISPNPYDQSATPATRRSAPGVDHFAFRSGHGRRRPNPDRPWHPA